jgi:hypothetical protein
MPLSSSSVDRRVPEGGGAQSKVEKDMKTVWKWPSRRAKFQRITMPVGTEIVSVARRLNGSWTSTELPSYSVFANK